MKEDIKKAIEEIDRNFERKPIKLDWRARNEEYAKTKTGIKALNWYNQIKTSNSYAEAKQHNLI